MSKEVINNLREIKKSLNVAANRIEDLIELASRSNSYSNISEDIEKIFTRHMNDENRNAKKMSNKLLSVKEVAKLMQINPSRTYKLINNRYLKGLKLGARGLRIPESEYERFIRENLGKDLSKLIE